MKKGISFMQNIKVVIKHAFLAPLAKAVEYIDSIIAER